MVHYMDNTQENHKKEPGQDYIACLGRMWKWSLLISILGFIATFVLFIIGTAAVVFLCIFNKGESGSSLTAWLGSSYLIAAGIFYFIPVLRLFQFSKNIRDAIHENDNQLINKAMGNLRSCFVWFGILVIVGIVLYIITFFILGASVTLLKDIV